MKYCVYILYSLKDYKLYVGCTSNIKNRLNRHEYGQVRATKHRRPLICIHKEFHEKADAFNRERFLKSLWGAREKRKIKENFLKNSQSSA